MIDRLTLNRRRLLTNLGVSATLLALNPVAAAAQTPLLRRSFCPGEVWTDTAGKPIQAHGGSILKVGDTFYWYGENKEFTTGKTDIWTWGVRCYASTDLYNWRDLGLIIAPNQTDKSSPLHPAAGLDRPHILYNSRTRKFVCWLKILFQGGSSRTVLTADTITGPYTIVAQGIHPLGMKAGDFDLVIAPEDNKAYMYFERMHTEIICADLTDDYTGLTGYYSTHFPHAHSPEVREGPAFFQRGGKHYLMTSGTSGYYPNASEVAVADSFHGPFAVMGDVHPDDRSRSSYNSQISSVFKHPAKRNLYIALADRWQGPLGSAAFESGETNALIQSAFAKVFSFPRIPFTPAEATAFAPVPNLKIDTSKSRYVWLPITFEGDRPVIHWRDEWTIEEFD